MFWRQEQSCYLPLRQQQGNIMALHRNYTTLSEYELACKDDPSVAATPVDVAARVLGETIGTIEEMIACGFLPAVKISDQTLALATVVEQYGEIRREKCEARRRLLEDAHATLAISYKSLLDALAPLGDHKDDPELMSRVTELVLDHADLHCGHTSPAPFHQIAPMIERVQKRAECHEVNHHK
jgi:hypothetical protein